MKEQLIKFETAKLAKEKGFDCQTRRYYGVTGIGHSSRQPISQNSIKSGGCLRVTQSLLQKWLRDEHKIFVNPIPSPQTKYGQHHLGIVFNNDEGMVDTIILKDVNVNLRVINKLFDTYEEALEAGLIEALKLI